MYTKKKFMTNSELHFYNKIKDLEENYHIIPQVNLAAIIKKEKYTNYYTDLFRNIDFGIFSKDYEDILVLIELNDYTHNQPKRYNRDLKVNNICIEANIPLITINNVNIAKEDILKIINQAIYDKNSIIATNRAKYSVSKASPKKNIETKFIIRLIISIILLIMMFLLLFS